jgi:hypothetical protein
MTRPLIALRPASRLSTASCSSASALARSWLAQISKALENASPQEEASMTSTFCMEASTCQAVPCLASRIPQNRSGSSRLA